MDPFRLLLISLAGWMNQQQQEVIEYLQEENRVLREQLGDKRLRLNNDQRRRLAVRAKRLGRRVLHELTTTVTPETLLAWHRRLIAQKYDGSKQRSPGRPHTALGHVPPAEFAAWDGARPIPGGLKEKPESSLLEWTGNGGTLTCLNYVSQSGNSNNSN
jgi:hypothetical protein